jgi:probable rRNA maturation factor
MAQPSFPARRTRRPRAVAADASRHEVDVVDRQRSLRLPRGWLAGVVHRALARQGITTAEVCVLLVDDRRIARLHADWLGVAGPTDVITFASAAAGPPDGVLRGDIVASAETARRVARAVGWQPRQELAYYVIHGILHLAGNDDMTAADRRAMRARERVLLAAAGLPPAPRPRRARNRP